MPRWRLTQPHYLNVPGTEWEYKEVNRTTGKQGRKVFEVHMYLNPNDPSDCNYPGEIIVAHEKGAHHQDIIFVGPPTPDMEPLDAEAQAITDALSPSWVHPIESLPGQGYSQSLIADFQKQMAEAMTKSVSTPGISRTEIDDLKSQVAELIAQNKALSTQQEKRRA